MNPDKVLPLSASCHDVSVADASQRHAMRPPAPLREGVEGLWV